MKLLKKNLVVISVIALSLIFTCIGFLTADISGTSFMRPLISLFLGVGIAAGAFFVKEKHLYAFSGISYALIIALFAISLISENSYGMIDSYLSVFGLFSVYLPALLPLTCLQVARMTENHGKKKILSIILIALVILIPALAVLFQAEMSCAFIYLAVCYISLLIMKKENRINIPWFVFLFPVVLSVIAFMVMYSVLPNFAQRIDLIFFRQQTSSDAAWICAVYDRLLNSTPFIVSEGISAERLSDVDFVSTFCDSNIFMLIVSFGWIVLAVLLAAYSLFFTGLFNMVKKTRQSTFSHGVSLMSALFLLIQAISGVAGIFIQPFAYIDMPFIANSLAFNIINLVLVGIITSLYICRGRKACSANK